VEHTASPPALRLDAPRQAVLERASELVLDAWRGFDRFRPGQPPIDDRMRTLLHEALPAGPTPVLEALADAAVALDQSLAQTRPRFFAYIGESALEIAVVADLVAATYGVNLAAWAGAASEVEAQACRWVGELVGFPVGAGSFTSGGTLSNLTALAAARERALPGSRREGLGGARGAVYCSREAHYSVTRACELLGLGAASVRRVATDDRRRVVPDALAEAIDGDRRRGVVPVAVVGTAGTTLTGAVDPLADLADLCAERGVWLHVDGAYGLPAAACPETAELFRGVERADSVSVDAHKWLAMPKACAVVLVREASTLQTTFAHDEDYMPGDRQPIVGVDMTVEYSRPFRALKLWLAFRVHGADAFREAIGRNLAQARLLYDEVVSRAELEPLCGPPQLSVVPFRHRGGPPAELDAHNERLAQRLQDDGRVWVATATVDGRVCLRPCVVNYRTTDDDVRALVELACELAGHE
jgi:aromatic-L-amino-acid decarboxylase